MSNLFPNYAKKSFEICSGEGCYVTDDAQNEYLDLTSGIGVMNLGYQVKRLNEVLAMQATTLWHMPNLYKSELQEEVARKLAKNRDYLAFFCNSGTEANEAAIKLARKATERTEIITFHHSFHGRTYGAMSATAQESIQLGFGPLLPGFSYEAYNDYEMLNQVTEQTAAVMLELIQGEGGVFPAEKNWIQALKQRCEQVGALLIVDEVQTGIGRTGTLFAYEQFEIEPDIFTLAKGLGNGFPVGAMLGKGKLATAFTPGSHGSTFGGNKLALRVANEVLTIFEEGQFMENVQKRSQQAFSELGKSSSRAIKEVRGLGLMIGIELYPEYPVAQVLTALEKAGVLALRAGTNTLRLLPPLIISEGELARGIKTIEEVLSRDFE